MPLVNASKLAVYKAFGRAIVSSRPPQARLFCDPYAKAFLSPAQKILLGLFRQPPLYHLFCWCMKKLYPGPHTAIAAGTGLVDEQVLHCIAQQGINQVVILAAGSDCRAHRLQLPSDIQFVELDDPAVQARKRQVLQQGRTPPLRLVDYIPIDLDTQQPEEVLPLQLLRSYYRTLFIWEDIHRFFTGNKGDKILGYLQRFPAGTRLVFTYACKNPGMFIGATPVLRLLQYDKKARHHSLDPAYLQTLLHTYNLELEQETHAAGYGQQYTGRLARHRKGYEWYKVAIARVKAKTIES